MRRPPAVAALAAAVAVFLGAFGIARAAGGDDDGPPAPPGPVPADVGPAASAPSLAAGPSLPKLPRKARRPAPRAVAPVRAAPRPRVVPRAAPPRARPQPQPQKFLSTR